MADLVYKLLSQVVKNTNITINLAAKPVVGAQDEPKKDEPKKDEPKKDEPKKDEPKTEAGSAPAPVDAEPQPPQESGLVRADLVQLINDLESVSSTLKRINRSLVGHEYTEVFFMLQNFDKILNSVKMVVNAV